jgi:hypothetical protein
MIKLRRKHRLWHVTLMGETKNAYTLVGKPEGSELLEYLGVERRIILT